MTTKKNQGPCFRCRRFTSHTIGHFELTGEYTPGNRQHFVCMSCEGIITFEKEMRRQQREMTASADELISGDFED